MIKRAQWICRWCEHGDSWIWVRLLPDDELPMKRRKETYRNTTLFRENLTRCVDVRDLNFLRLHLWQGYGLLVFTGRYLFQLRSPQWLLWGSFLPVTAWHLNRAIGFIDWSILSLGKQNSNQSLIVKVVKLEGDFICFAVAYRVLSRCSCFWCWVRKNTLLWNLQIESSCLMITPFSRSIRYSGFCYSSAQTAHFTKLEM